MFKISRWINFDLPALQYKKRFCVLDITVWLRRKDNKRSAELMYKGIENITICDHPLIKHKLSIIRQKTTGTNEFRTIPASSCHFRYGGGDGDT